MQVEPFVAALLISLVPAWVYFEITSKSRPPGKRHNLELFVQWAGAGIGTTGIAAAILILIPHRWVRPLLDLREWSRSGDASYLRHHADELVVTVVAVMLLATLIATCAGLARRKLSRNHFRPLMRVSAHALGDFDSEKLPWTSLEMQNGMVVEGLYYGQDIHENEESKRDIVLQGPIIRVTKPDGQTVRHNMDRFVVSESEVRFILQRHDSTGSGNS